MKKLSMKKMVIITTILISLSSKSAWTSSAARPPDFYFQMTEEGRGKDSYHDVFEDSYAPNDPTPSQPIPKPSPIPHPRKKLD